MELGTPRPVSCLHQLLAMSIWANCLNFPNLKILICRMGIIIVCIHPELWKLNYTFRNYNLNYTFKSLEQLALKTPYYYYYFFFYGEQLLLLFLYGEKTLLLFFHGEKPWDTFFKMWVSEWFNYIQINNIPMSNIFKFAFRMVIRWSSLAFSTSASVTTFLIILIAISLKLLPWKGRNGTEVSWNNLEKHSSTKSTRSQFTKTTEWERRET